MAQNQNTENVSNEIKITVRQPDVLELSKKFMNKLSPETFASFYRSFLHSSLHWSVCKGLDYT